LLIKELERVTKSLIIVSVPLNISQYEVNGNVFQTHISNWFEEDFRKLAFKIERVKMLPKTLEVADKIRRLAFHLPHAPGLIVAWKRLE
jgi:hypothetical protein